MTVAKFICPLLLGLGVSGCNMIPDDPQNIPLRGNWNGKIELASVDVNGHHFEGDRIPAALTSQLGGGSKNEELGCTEPKVNSIEELNAKMPDRFKDMCTMVPSQTGKGKISFESECDSAKLPEGVQAMSLEGEAETLPDRIDMTFRVRVTAKEADGSTSTIHMMQKRNYWRVGECSA